jgi:membrane-associated phospholipid phosphatase
MKQKKSELLRNFIADNSLILSLYLFLLSFSCILIFSYDKVNLHLFINQLVGSRYTNAFFYYITYLGDGFVGVFLLIVILYFNVRKSVYTGLSFLIASICSQYFKRYVFADSDRPWMVFQQENKVSVLHLVEGVDTHIHNSFPSGHATQAFAIFMCLVFTSSNRSLKLFFFFLALLTSFSRVYLSQHWLSDIVAGSLIGFLFSALFYILIYQHPRMKLLNRPLFPLRPLHDKHLS